MLLLGGENRIGARVVLLQNQAVVARLYLMRILWLMIGRLSMSKQANKQANKMFRALYHRFRGVQPTLEQMIKIYEVLGLDKEDI